MTWMNWMMILLASLNFGQAADSGLKQTVYNPPLLEIGGEETASDEEQTNGNPDDFIVVERLDEETAVIESPRGLFEIPRKLLPESAEYEGAVIAWAHRPDEGSRRLKEGYARIARMQEAGAY